MLKESRWHISYLSRYAMIAFFIMSTIFIFVSEDSLLFYNIELVNLKQLWLQIFIFIFLFMLFLTFHKYIFKIDIKALFVFFLLLYLLFFSFKAPAFSLIFGVFLISVPLMLFSVYKLFRKTEFRNTIIYGGALIIFLLIFFHLLNGIGKDFPVYIGTNLSKISHEKIFVEGKIDIITLGILVCISLIVFNFISCKKENKWISRILIIIAIVFVIIEVIALGTVMYYRTKTLSSPAYDFGIFTQMFHNMKNLNGMVTTLERQTALSHYAVHVSPIYYLILPFFMIFPYPETLQIVQVLIVSIGVIPIYLLGKHFKLSSMATLITIIMYIFHPALISSSFFDLHENCFLAPLLLFVIYFSIKQNIIGFIISFVLTLMIKEDAGIYLIFIGLFLWFSGFNQETKKQKFTNNIMSISLILISVVYFFIITSVINKFGDGAMFWRYDNLNGFDNLGLIGIPLSLFQSPSYWLATMFSPNKIMNLLIIFLVLGFIPLMNKKLSYYWLIVPLLVMNFSTTYPYQHQIGFQYYYGTIALLIMMVLLWFKDNENNLVNKIKFVKLGNILKLFVLAIIVISLYRIGIKTIDQKAYYKENYNNNSEMYDSMRETLLAIPTDKKVLATTWLTPYLADRYHLYHYSYYKLNEDSVDIDYIILDLRYLTAEDRSDIIQRFYLNGYKESELSTEFIWVLEPTT